MTDSMLTASELEKYNKGMCIMEGMTDKEKREKVKRGPSAIDVNSLKAKILSERVIMAGGYEVREIICTCRNWNKTFKILWSMAQKTREDNHIFDVSYDTPEQEEYSREQLFKAFKDHWNLLPESRIYIPKIEESKCV